MLEVNINVLRKSYGLHTNSVFLGLLLKSNHEYIKSIFATESANGFETTAEIKDGLYFDEFNELRSKVNMLNGAFEVVAVFTEQRDTNSDHKFYILKIGLAIPAKAILDNSHTRINNLEEWESVLQCLFTLGIYWKSDTQTLSFNPTRIPPFNPQIHSFINIKSGSIHNHHTKNQLHTKTSAMSPTMIKVLAKNSPNKIYLTPE